ncbi:hypothetical protein TWF718_009324 [Orbilia javanica]|uniref:Uncharacterized protein n=1 Tax=Orbilia javanica TaxID=47235 RepID=A0AAN8RGK2_9PEZI
MYSNTKLFQQADSQDYGLADTNEFGAQTPQPPKPFEQEERPSVELVETTELKYEVDLDFGFGKLFSIDDPGAKVIDAKAMKSTSLCPKAHKAAQEVTEKMKAWADDLNTPLQSQVMHLPYAWKAVIRSEMTRNEDIRTWNEQTADFSDLLKFLEIMTYEYQLRQKLSNSSDGDVIIFEIQRYLAVFFECEDEATRLHIFRRFLHDGIEYRKKTWIKAFGQSRKSLSLRLKVEEDAVRLYCSYAPDLEKTSTIWEVKNAEGTTFKQAEDFTVGIDGKITILEKPVIEQKHEFSNPPPRQLPPHTPPKGVKFKQGYKFDSTFFDGNGKFAIPIAAFDVIDTKVDRPRKRYDDEGLLLIDAKFASVMGKYINEVAQLITTVVSKMPGSNIQLKVFHGEQAANGLIRKFESLLTNNKKGVILQDTVSSLSQVNIFNCFWKTMCQLYENSVNGQDYDKDGRQLVSDLQEQLSRIYGELQFKQIVSIQPDCGVRIIQHSEDLENSRRMGDSTLYGMFGTPEQSGDEENEDAN